MTPQDVQSRVVGTSAIHHPRPSSPGLTDEQHQAVTLRAASIVLSSGAGCGKTHVLTERYLSHLRDDRAEVNQIVAITFTDRAARQMRARIRSALLQEVRAAATDTDVERWSGHLRGLETAPISTIHAFCGTLLRQHAVEIGLDPSFDVIEDVLSANLEAEALTDCLQELLTARTEAGEDLRQLVLLHGWRATVEAVQQLMRAWDEPNWRRWLQDPPEKIAEQWQRERVDLLPRYLDHLLASSPRIVRCLALLRNTPCLGPEMRARVERLLHETPRLAEAADLSAAVQDLKETAKVSRERAKAWPSSADYEAVKKALEGYRDELPDRLQRFLEPADTLPVAAAVGQRFLRVADTAARAYRQRKRRAAAVDFQDLLVLARDLLRDQREVRDRLQRRFQFFLIDELQDTDPVQMELVRHLCGLGLTEGKLFSVGDAKQAIYRFRGADVTLFEQLREGMPQQGRLDLTFNFRSQPAILDFVNALFARHIQNYERLQAHHSQFNSGPCVEFLWSPRNDKELAAEARRREADAIARRIAQMVGQRERLVSERGPNGGSLRPVELKDVVLLFRAMSNVHIYEAALRNHGLDYYLVGGRAFFAQQEIYDLLNLLRALENPQDAVSLAGTLRSPFCCLNDEALLLLGRQRAGLWAGLHDDATIARLPADQRAPAERARRFLDRWHSLKDRLPIALLLGEVFADAGYDAAMRFEQLGDRKLANLWKLLELARTFDRSGLFGLAEFIQRLGDLVQTQPREEQAATQPENADVVRLLTIHQAKGLEFPIVFVPDLAAAGGGSWQPVAHWDAAMGCVVRAPADEDPAPFTNFSWQLWKAAEEIADWDEELRTLYVACTRAQDYLVLSASLYQPPRLEGPWMLTLAERFELDSGACLAADVPAERVPQVRVTDYHTLLSQSAVLPRKDRRMAEPLSPDAATQVAPIPVHWPDRAVVPAKRWASKSGQSAGLFSPPELSAPPFDAEDGSDRYTWERPRDRLEPGDDSAAAVRERVLRQVLERWDWQNSEEWRSLLATAQQVELSLSPESAAEVARMLAGFAASATFRRLAQATACHRELEFLLTEPALADSESPTARPIVGGVIDCLWQDSAGAWHLLAYTTDRPATRARRDRWRGWKRRLTVWAEAVRQRLQVWPRSVTLYCLDDATVVESPWPF